MRLARASRGVIATNREDEESLQFVARRRMIPIGSSIKRRALTASERAAYRRSHRRGRQSSAGTLWFRSTDQGRGLPDRGAGAHTRNSGKSVRLVFIGERSNTVDDGADSRYSACIGRAESAGMTWKDAVHTTGFLPDDEVSAWLSAVDLMVLPYLDGASVSAQQPDRGAASRLCHNYYRTLCPCGARLCKHGMRTCGWRRLVHPRALKTRFYSLLRRASTTG